MEKIFTPNQEWSQNLQKELLENILPFWMRYGKDTQNGGFCGAVSNDLQVNNEEPRTAILISRILWTYSTAYRLYRAPEYLDMARTAYEYLSRAFIDSVYGGVYWSVDKQGQPVSTRKHSYVQAFAIYGLSEYYRAAGEKKALVTAQELFKLLNRFAYEPKHGGYLEGRARNWSAQEENQLSSREPVSQKSMNTLLHVLEGFTNLLRVWDDPTLRERITELVNIFSRHVIDPQTFHFRLFFDDEWNVSGDVISNGHDIEGSWLLCEAAEALGDTALIARTQIEAIKIASAVVNEGLWPDGSLIYETKGGAPINDERHWWVAAEGMVGFYNAYQLTGETRFLEASHRCWEFAEQHFVDRQNGEWFKVLDAQYIPVPDRPKMGPWECPYHHSRACFEMMKRLAG